MLTTGSRYMQHLDLRTTQALARNEPCAACRFVDVCGCGCHASARARSGSILGKDPIACEFFLGGIAQQVVKTVRACNPQAWSPILDDPRFS